MLSMLMLSQWTSVKRSVAALDGTPAEERQQGLPQADRRARTPVFPGPTRTEFLPHVTRQTRTPIRHSVQTVAVGSDLPGVTSLGRYREPEPNAAKAEKKVPPKKAVKSSEEEDESSNSSESCFGSDCSDDEAGSSDAATAESCSP